MMMMMVVSSQPIHRWSGGGGQVKAQPPSGALPGILAIIYYIIYILTIPTINIIGPRADSPIIPVPIIPVNVDAAQPPIHAAGRQEQVARSGDGPVEHPSEAGRLRRVRRGDGISVRGGGVEVEGGAGGGGAEGEE